MPALRIFGKKTLLAGDDLHVPCLVAISLRLFQCLVLAVIILLWSDDCRSPLPWSDCQRSSCAWLWTWIGLCYAYGMASLYHETCTFYWSSQGNPVVVTEPRTTKVQQLLQRRLWFGSGMLFTMGSIGIVALWKRTVCDVSPPARWWWILAAALLILTQLGEVGFLWLFVCQLLVFTEEEEATTRNTYNHDMAQELWAHRCRFACHCLSYTTCYTFGGRHAVNHHNSVAPFSDVAAALADFLESRNILDLTLTDWIAGLWVLQRLQKQRVYASRRRLVNAAVSSDSMRSNSLRQRPSKDREEIEAGEDFLLHQHNHRSPWYTLESSSSAILTLEELPFLDECARYAKYALAIYTWVLYLYDNPVTGPGKLFWRSMLCCGEKRVLQDNMLQAHKNAILLTAGIPESDLVYVQLESSFEDNPYCVILDHAWKSVVISVRGTFSLEDVITDTLVEPVSLEALGQEFGFDGTNQFCHGGVFACARNVYRDLEEKGILRQLLLAEDAPYPDYTLRLTGHSLGASTASLLSLMLKQQFPSLRCIIYSPAGCTFTWELALSCRDWCVSSVLDSDLVPRLSIDSLRHLRDEVLQLIGRIRVPKIELARRLFRSKEDCKSLLWCLFNHSFLDGDEHEDVLRRRLKEVLYDVDDVPVTEFHQQLAMFSEVQSERLIVRSPVKLFPPGRILLLAKTGEKHTCRNSLTKLLTCCTMSSGSEYMPVWVENDELDEIVVSPTMGTDHFPNRISAVLHHAASEFLSESKRS